jgi:hypothetical protein
MNEPILGKCDLCTMEAVTKIDICEPEMTRYGVLVCEDCLNYYENGQQDSYDPT